VTELSAATSWASSSSTATSAARPRSRPPAGRARPPSHPHSRADGRGALSFPAHEAAAITVASGQSSLQAFRVGIGVAGALVIIAGLMGAARIRNPQRIVHAGRCPGAQLAGAPLDAAGLHASQAA
jgi:hypothetical protein